MTELDDQLPEGAIDLGHDTYYTKAVDKNGLWVAIHEWHKNPKTGKWCAGYVAFERPEAAWYVPSSPHWDVISEEPLTLSPSLLCTTCQHHGFIREGRWEPC